MPTLPVTFRRSALSKVLSLLVHVLMVPLLTAVVGLLLGGALLLVLTSVSVPRDPAGAVFLAVFPAVGSTLIVSAVRNYRRNNGTIVTVHPDRLEIETPGRRVTVGFDQVVDVRLVPRRLDAVCSLHLLDQSEVAIPFQVANFSTIRGALEATLIGRLACQMGQDIGAGRTVRIRESPLRAWTRVPLCLCCVVLGTFFLCTIRGICSGVLLIRHGLRHGRRGWRGRRTDFEVSRKGVNRDPHWPSAICPWSDLRDLRCDTTGIVLRFSDGRMLAASPFAENYWPFAVWIRQAWHDRA